MPTGRHACTINKTDNKEIKIVTGQTHFQIQRMATQILHKPSPNFFVLSATWRVAKRMKMTKTNDLKV